MAGSTETIVQSRTLEGIDDETAWAAVLDRDRSFDGRFVYAVRTTGVFCRSGCSSRRSDRRHVSFFPRPAEARTAGFRPCRRCVPDSALSPEAEAVQRVRAHIEAHLDERLTLGDLAPVAGLSPAHLQRRFKAALGLSPREYVRARRAERFKREARRGRSVTDALYRAGYGSGSRLYEESDARLGMTPGAYRRGGEGQLIRYTTAPCALGLVLVASTERGLCAVQIGDSARGLEEALARDYPRAERRRDDAALRPALAAILAHLDGAVPRLDLSLDVAASAFQMRVWRALQDIPYGERRSYAEIAAAVGEPRAARAVARACASNRVALLVPCHRVVRSDGALGGYRWGEARKRRLLEGERRHAAGGSR
jgi:AraC family transcriptional regulator of adaptative response/methylated-DNA-[protein]-cysteine methyltransferase